MQDTILIGGTKFMHKSIARVAVVGTAALALTGVSTVSAPTENVNPLAPQAASAHTGYCGHGRDYGWRNPDHWDYSVRYVRHANIWYHLVYVSSDDPNVAHGYRWVRCGHAHV